MPNPILAAALALMAVPGAALAHTGHVAELAGHSHWLGLAAVAAAAALAAFLAKSGSRRGKEDDTAPNADEAGEQASAAGEAPAG